MASSKSSFLTILLYRRTTERPVPIGSRRSQGGQDGRAPPCSGVDRPGLLAHGARSGSVSFRGTRTVCRSPRSRPKSASFFSDNSEALQPSAAPLHKVRLGLRLALHGDALFLVHHRRDGEEGKNVGTFFRDPDRLVKRQSSRRARRGLQRLPLGRSISQRALAVLVRVSSCIRFAVPVLVPIALATPVVALGGTGPQAFARQLAAGSVEPISPHVDYAGVSLAGAEFRSSIGHGIFDIDYTAPTKQEVRYFSATGMNIFRIPVRWERLQHTLFEELDARDLKHLDGLVDLITRDLRRYVIVDLHNYFRFEDRIVGDGVSASALADFWTRMASRYRGNPNVWFGLMNEPYGVCARQVSAVQHEVLHAIRNSGATNVVLVQGSAWSSAETWHQRDANCGVSNASTMRIIDDPQGRLLFEVHQYLDADASGVSNKCVSADIGAERLATFTAWLRRHHKRGFLGEFASGQNQLCLAALHKLLAHIEANSDVWAGWTYWAAGPWWGNYRFSIEPRHGADAAQLGVLIQYLPASSQPASPNAWWPAGP